MENKGKFKCTKRTVILVGPVVQLNNKVDLQDMKEKRLQIMETMTKEELMSLIDETRKQIDQWLSFEGPIFLMEHNIRICSNRIERYQKMLNSME